MADYDPELCEAFDRRKEGPFIVPGGGTHRLTIDCTHCGGHIQNYQITLMKSPKRTTPSATLAVFDQHGVRVGGSHPYIAEIGSVPADAVYTVVVTGAKKQESCVLQFTGAI